MNGIVKVCPRCRDEFESWVETCPDCGGALEWKPEDWSGWGTPEPLAPRPVPRSGLPPLEPSPDLVLIRAEEPGWIETLSARLTAAGIRSFTSLAPDPSIPPDHQGAWVSQGQGRYFLYVRPEDCAASLEVDRALLMEQFVDVEGFEGFPTQRAGTCPACGAALPQGATECPSCELSFGWPDDAVGDDVSSQR